jgi:hypothetical protein
MFKNHSMSSVLKHSNTSPFIAVAEALHQSTSLDTGIFHRISCASLYPSM